MIARAASFLLLADTQASFAIEGERLPVNIRERWLKAVKQVGKYLLSKEELNRLHSILIGDYRFISRGLETIMYFSERGQQTMSHYQNLLGHGAQDLDDLINGLAESKCNYG